MKFFHLVVLPLVCARVVRNQQVPIIGDSRDVEAKVGTFTLLETVEEDAPTVGVHFTTSYAVASVRYLDGTMRDLGKIAGDAEYIDLMSRWTMGEDVLSRNWYVHLHLTRLN